VTWIAAASAQGFVDVIDLPAWKKVATISGVMAGMYRPVFSGDRSRLAIGSSGKESVTIWDTVSFERLLTLPTSRSVTGIIGFSPDGNLLLARTGAGAMDVPNDVGAVFVWRAPSWAEIAAAEGAAAAR
jgi:WD40 repeat protein